jgi:hypothetical protein
MKPVKDQTLKTHLSGLLDQVVRASPCGLLSLINIDPIELSEGVYLVTASDPHQTYEVWHDDIEWHSDCYDLEDLLKKLSCQPKNNTEIWAAKYLSANGYVVAKNNNIVALRGKLCDSFFG